MTTGAGYQSLERPEGWADGYYLQPKSLVIYYRARVRGRPCKFSTGIRATDEKGVFKIPREAKLVVEEKHLLLMSTDPNRKRREKKGCPESPRC